MAKRAVARPSGARRALVTGASAGIGLAFAERLAREHYDLILVARNAERLAALAQGLRQRHGIAAEPLSADLTDSSELRVVEQVIAGDQQLELLVNNAGFGTVGPFVRLDPDREEAEVKLNVLALTRLTRAALPGMVARHRGAIINVSSLAALQPTPFNATYAATKAFVNSFTEALHEELRGTGVQVQALCPGFTRTEFQERAGIDTSHVPSFVWMTPDAVVAASLAALQRGSLICIPGLGNQVLAAAANAAPRSLVRRLAGMIIKP